MNPKIFERALAWFQTGTGGSSDIISETRDVFQARLDHLRRELLGLKPNQSDEIALVTLVIGEIGNNCFDHNLGQWRDVAGCWFQWHYEAPSLNVVLGDRGQGILSSLKRVLPTIQNDLEALHLAFEKRISGRSPEKRGNGLKLVRNILNGHSNRCLVCFSGNGKINFGGLNTLASSLNINLSERGVLIFLSWNF